MRNQRNHFMGIVLVGAILVGILAWYLWKDLIVGVVVSAVTVPVILAVLAWLLPLLYRVYIKCSRSPEAPAQTAKLRHLRKRSTQARRQKKSLARSLGQKRTFFATKLSASRKKMKNFLEDELPEFNSRLWPLVRKFDDDLKNPSLKDSPESYHALVQQIDACIVEIETSWVVRALWPTAPEEQ
jgi:phosphate/sulfate permease